MLPRPRTPTRGGRAAAASEPGTTTSAAADLAGDDAAPRHRAGAGDRHQGLLHAGVLHPVGLDERHLVQNDRILVQKVSYWGGGSPQRGDVVVFSDPGGWLDPAETQAPNNPVARVLELFGLYPTGGHLVKRVIGVGGDEVKCCDAQGRITVNGVPLNEKSYLAPRREAVDDQLRRQGRARLPLGAGRQPVELGRLPRSTSATPAAARCPPTTSSARCSRWSGRSAAPRCCTRPRRSTSRSRSGALQRDCMSALPEVSPSARTPASTATSGPCAGSGSTRSPASTRPGGAPAPVRWSPPRRCCPTGKAGSGPRARRLQAADRRGARALLREVQRRAVAWSVVVVEHDECDRLGMHVANVEALRRSLARLDVRRRTC